MSVGHFLMFFPLIICAFQSSLHCNRLWILRKLFPCHTSILHVRQPLIRKETGKCVSQSQHFRDSVVKRSVTGIIIPHHYFIPLGSQKVIPFKPTYTHTLRRQTPVLPQAVPFLTFMCKFVKRIKWKIR